MRQRLHEKHANFKQEMMPYTDMLYSYAYYLSGDRDKANDLHQETYLKAYRFFDKFEIGTNAKAWLFRIMKNTFINEYRRVKRLPDLLHFDEQISSYQMLPLDSQQSTDIRDVIEKRMLNDELAGAISSLPEKFKSVVVLRDIEDLPYEEIAEALDIPIGTVRSRLHRARALLFNKLRGYASKRGYSVAEDIESRSLAVAG